MVNKDIQDLSQMAFMNNNGIMVRSRAPLRISFSGGGTDVMPFPREKGGCVLSATIDKYCYATIIPRNDEQIKLTSLDYDTVAKYKVKEKLEYDGKLDLIKASFNVMNISEGLNLFICTDAPPGTGLGSSSTLVVAVVGAIAQWKGLPLTNYEISELAYKIEREELGIFGGLQDQYAATFGGFNFIEFQDSIVIVNPLRIKQHILNELHFNFILCYTGGIRLSANIVRQQTESYRNRKPKVVSALEELKHLTIEMKNALLRGELNNFGLLLHESWKNKKKLHPSISNSKIDEMYTEAQKNGALGGKILGAGGGGYLLIYCPFSKKHIVASRLEALGGQIVNFNFDNLGLQKWTIYN